MSVRMPCRKAWGIIVCLALTALMTHPALKAAKAAEAGVGVYLLGFRSSMAGYVPPPGTYFQNDAFYYSGKANISAGLPFGGIVVSGRVEAEAFIELPTLLWVAPDTILGGHLGFTATLPVGWQKVGGALGAGGLGVSRTDTVTGIGDFFPTAMLGWHHGNLHWNVNAAVNVPVGSWKQGRLSNLGFNYWAFDFGAAFTWLDQKTGMELSVAPGVTINTENSATNYTTGEEFHVEFAAVQHFSQQLAAGLGGYHYQQVGKDRGSGAVFGAFKGQVTALGPTLSYTFNVNGLPVSTNLRWLHEFNVKRRLEGDSVLFTFAVPLGVSGK